MGNVSFVQIVIALLLGILLMGDTDVIIKNIKTFFSNFLRRIRKPKEKKNRKKGV